MKPLPAICLLLTATFLACTPRLPVRAGLERLRQMPVGAPGLRTLAELDVSGDGKLDEVDAGFFAELAESARGELTRRGRNLAVTDQLYHGAPTDAPGLWQTLEPVNDALNLAGMSDERLFELAVESRWLSLQVRVAMLGGAAPDAERFFGLLVSRVPGWDADAMEPAALCAAVEAVDLQPLFGAGLIPTVVLDLDSTVWDGNVMDPFLAALVAQGRLSEAVNPRLRDYLSKLADVDVEALAKASAVENAGLLLERWTNTSLPAAARPNAKDMFYLIVNMLEGLSTADAEEAARAVFSDPPAGFVAWGQRTFADRDGCGMRRVIQLLQQRGVEVYILSATLDLLAWEGARMLGVPRERSIGSLLEVKDGRYTGEVKDSAYYTKGAIVRQWLSAPPLLAFGDSPSSDLSMLLEAFGASFMINPRPAFLELDEKEAGGKLVAVTFDGTEESLTAAP